uniref:Protein piccolo n=1 Tax=Musca domestica TaxID=7370 RepID=A0A1I8MFX5_MUSDO
MSSGYGSGQRMPAQSNYEAPACVQNAMTRDKKPFTYTPGGIDLSQIKSERMAKRLARNACAEGAAGQSQQNRPGGAVQQPTSPSSPGSAAAVIGAAGMGMPFQVLPPTPQPVAGKNTNGGCGPAPPPPPPPTSFSNMSNTTAAAATLAPHMNGGGVNGGRGSAPNSPNMQRKIPPAPPSQRFEPPPLGFRPEIKIPPNPMAALRKVPPPVEKNTFWKDEYLKNKGGSDAPAPAPASAPANSAYTEDNDSVNGSSSTTPSQQTTNGSDQLTTATTNGETNNSDTIDGFRKTMPTTTTNKLQANQQTNNYPTNTQDQQQQQEPLKTPTSPHKPSQESEKPQQKSPQNSSPDTQSLSSTHRPTPPTSPHQKLSSPSVLKQIERETGTPPAASALTSPPKSVTPIQIQTDVQQQQRQPSPKPEFRSAATASPQPAAVNLFNRQTDSPRSVENATPPRVTESPFRLAQQQQQQQRAPVAISPLAQQTTSTPLSAGPSPGQPQAQTVPWRTQRGQTPQQQGPTPTANTQSHPQPFYNNVQQQQQQQRTPDFSTQTSAYQGPKPTNVGSLYIAPLAAPVEPQAQHIVRQQMQQQQKQPQRDSPMRQMGGPQPGNQQLRWMSSQPKQTEQPPWARPEENGNVVPSSLNRIKSPPPPPTASSYQAQTQQQALYQQQQQPQPSVLYQPSQPQPYNQGNGFLGQQQQQQPATQNFGAVHNAPAGLRLQINTKAIQNNNNSNASNQSGPRERIIPIQLEQTPTYTPPQPNFNTTPAAYSAGTGTPGYVMRTPNQFVDQGYNNFGVQNTPQRVMSPPMQQQQAQQQQLNAPRMVQQQQQQAGSNRTHIVPIAMEGGDGTRGPISKTPIVIQNGDYNLVVHDCPLEAEIRFRKNRLSDLRTPPVQSKSFRILQKITDTIDDGNSDESGNQQRNDSYMDAEPQLQRPTFARQMSAQQARNSPTVEQMRRMKIGQEQGNTTPQTPSQFNQQPRPFYNTNNDYIPPSEQHVPEPKKYTGSAIPSRSFKILQAMTQPENAGDLETNSIECNDEEMNDESKSDFHVESCNTSSAEPVSSTSLSSLSSSDSICSGPTPPPTQAPLGYAPYPYPYVYPWYPPPPACDSAGNPIWPFVHAMSPSPSQSGSETGSNTNPSWYYPYAMPPPPPPPATPNGESQQSTTHPSYPPYPYYYPYYPIPAPPPPPFPATPSSSTEFDGQNVYAPYLPPPPPYHSYPYPVAPSYSQSSACSSRASSVLPDIIITPSTDDVPSKVIMQHHIKVEKEKSPKQRESSLDIEDVTSEKSSVPKQVDGSIVDILTQHLQNLSQTMENNLDSSLQSPRKTYEKYFEQKSPDDNTSPIHISMVEEEDPAEDSDSSESSADSDATTKQYDTRLGKEGSVPLQAIRSVTNIQFYNKLKNQQLDQEEESEDSEDDDDATTADGESDVFDEDIEEIEFVYEHQGEGEEEEEVEEELHEEVESECEEFIVEDNLSVIYEEESDYDKSSDYGKPSTKKLDELEACIEENSGEEETKPEEEDNSVTVRLPLKFSFGKLANDTTPTATLVVGNSLVEEPQKSPSSNDKPLTSFSVATVETDSDAEDDSCDVSVTISLPRSSRSGSLDSEHRNNSAKYPIDEMPLPEEALPKIESSQEDVSFSISLNKRNKFVDQTLKGDITNNIAQERQEVIKEVEKKEEEPPKPQEEPKIDLMKSTSNFDFFATLMATKMQAQKIKEESANYWGKPSSQNSNEGEKTGGENSQSGESESPKVEIKSTEKPKRKEEVKTQESTQTSFKSQEPQESTQTSFKAQEPLEVPKVTQKPKIELPKVPEFKDDLKARTSFWSKYSTNNKTSANKAEVAPETPSKPAEPQTDVECNSKSPSTSWDSNSSKTDSQNSQDQNQEEIDDIWGDRDDDLVIRKERKLMYWDKYSKSSSGYETETQMDDTTKGKAVSPAAPEIKEEQSLEVEQSDTLETPVVQEDDIEDIWADRDDDLPAVKNLSKKLDSLQSAKDSFWSSVAEANKVSDSVAKEANDFWSQLKAPKKKPRAESITEILYSPLVLRHRIDELAKALRATLHTQEEPEPEESEEEIEVKEENVEEKDEEEEIDFWAQIEESKQKSFEEPSPREEEPEIMAEENEIEKPIAESTNQSFDPLKYPEEPREVDTDEEIDFWAEIEANRLPDDVEVTFERAATFWASRDRRNSADETPHKPVLPKPFAARLPDEPIKEDINIWATLEAHKGEEPIIVDPQVEEEQQLAQEFEEIIPQEADARDGINDSVMDLASVHEPVQASIWAPSSMQENQMEEKVPAQQAKEEPDFWAEIEKSRSSSLDKEKSDNLETKRKNFRQAKAFFTNSVDEPKEEVKEKTENVTEKSSKKSDEDSVKDDNSKEEGKKVKKPPKKEVKAKSKSKSPKGKSKELKAAAAAKSPSSDLPEVYVEPTLKRLANGLPDLEVTKFYEERKVSVRDRISVFETSNSTETAPDSRRNSITNPQKLSVDSNSSAVRRSSLSRNSSSQRSESEIEEDDSGVTDMNKLSETETESGSFPELRKMSSYQRAATHSRLFKLLQDDPDALEENNGDNKDVDEFQLRPSRRKVVHNVSITRKQNPNALAEVETMSQRRERLSLPLRKNTSIDADNPSTPNSPASPILDQPSNQQSAVSDQLVSELVQSLLLKSDSTHLRKLPMEKLQAAAKRVLEEELDSLENTSVDSTPAMTPSDNKKDKSYADYYNTWSNANKPSEATEPRSLRSLQDNRRSPWTVRCPRVLSSKTINRDLARVTESPEIFLRSSKSPECFRQSRESSVSRWKKA